MSMVECKSCGCWAEPDAEGAYDKGALFGWKCAECLAEDGEKADDHGYRVPDEEATIDGQCVKAAFFVMDTINGREGNPDGRDALREILQGAIERQK